MSKIIGLLGFINSGKGTVATQLVQDYNFRQDSFANSLKDACSLIFDWPRCMLEGDTPESRAWREVVDPWWSEKLGIPNFSPRLALQVVGTDALRNNFHEDLWFLTLQNRIRKNPDQHVVISDVRFPNEIRFIQEQGGKLIKINRGPAPVWYETALLANRGNSLAKEAMTKTYSTAHFSEWAWVGSKIDYEVNNDSTIEFLNSQVKEILTAVI
jgi:hypothetical protein